MIPNNFAIKFLDEYDLEKLKRKELTYLTFCKEKTLKSIEDVKTLATILKKDVSIKNLYLYHVEIEDKACQLLGKAIQKSVGLKEGVVVIVPNTFISPQGLKALIRHSSTHIQLINTEVVNSIKYMTVLAEILETNLLLKGLQIQQSEISDKVSPILAEGLAKSKGIKQLTLERNSFSYEGWKTILSAIPRCINLSSLSITLNKDATELKTLIEVLSKCSTLIGIHLSNGIFTAEELENLLTALAGCKKLSYIDLNECKIRDAGALVLASVLGDYPELAYLHLNGNDIGEEGIKALTIVLPKLLHLRALSLGNNIINDAGLKTLIQILPDCSSLSFLTLSNNPISVEGVKSLNSVLPYCQALKDIFFPRPHTNNDLVWDNLESEIMLILQECPTIEVIAGIYNPKIGLICEQHKQKRIGLLKAVEANNFKLVEHSLAEGASLLVRDDQDNTPLHLSAKKGYLLMVQWILKRKPSLLLMRNKEGKTSLELSVENNHKKVIDYLSTISSSTIKSTLLQPVLRKGFTNLKKIIPASPNPASSYSNSNSNHLPTAMDSFPQPVVSLPSSSSSNPGVASAPLPYANASASVTSSTPILGQDTDSLAIPKLQLTLKEELGEGAFGKVYRGEWHHTKLHHTPVAIKQLKLGALTPKLASDFKREVELHAKLNSPYIVKLYGITAEQPYCMVMELMVKGSLRDVLDTCNVEEFPWALRLSIAEHILQALVYLHRQQPPIVHGDLKSLNILLNEKMEAKVADFGLATLKIETSSRMTERDNTKPQGSLLWMPPELFKMNAKKNIKTDMYSLAVVLWELASHLFPYRSAEGNQTLISRWILEGQREAFDERTPGTPAEYQHITEMCWHSEPAKRLTASEALQQLESIPTFGKNPTAPSFFTPVAPINPPINASAQPALLTPPNFIANHYVPAEPAVKKQAEKNTPTPAIGNRYI